jgi:hypothetical protein
MARPGTRSHRRGENRFAPYRNKTEILLGGLLSSAGLSKRQYDKMCMAITHPDFKKKEVISYKCD